MSATTSRRLLLLSVVIVAAVVFQPQPTVASGTVGGLHDILQGLEAPDALTGARTEALLNAGMFVPMGLFAMLAYRSLRWPDVVTGAFLGSLLVETVQGIFLDARSTQAIDVVTNTFGGLVGALLGVAVRRHLARRSPH